ncbi:hypothetical protein [Allorhizocola rhizosphaerae]|uniref:hypothetical protein n=1 Tax=Allorhizocola rhizosphaerae TaxID=1872709 RepID=UPI0013C30D50|nr:hypothetical protein [Allorhizocola rhizosphaerae]
MRGNVIPDIAVGFAAWGDDIPDIAIPGAAIPGVAIDRSKGAWRSTGQNSSPQSADPFSAAISRPETARREQPADKHRHEQPTEAARRNQLAENSAVVDGPKQRRDQSAEAMRWECQRIFVSAFHPSAGNCGSAWQGAALTPARR